MDQRAYKEAVLTNTASGISGPYNAYTSNPHYPNLSIFGSAGTLNIYPQTLHGETMNKDLYLIITESCSQIDTAKTLEEAQSKARTYSNRNKCEVWLAKAVWSCAPKTDLVEVTY